LSKKVFRPKPSFIESVPEGVVARERDGALQHEGAEQGVEVACETRGHDVKEVLNGTREGIDGIGHCVI
jgi:hypothetical protein